MSTTDWKQIADHLNAHLAHERLSSQDVAQRAGVDRKTVDRLRSGRAVRQQTLSWIEQALQIVLSAQTDQRVADIAPLEHGSYRRDMVAGYVGMYTTYRRSFDHPGQLIASYLEICWDDEAGTLRFTEDQHNHAASGKAYEYHFGGDVLIPPNLGVMHFVVHSGDGRVRLISTSMPRDDHGTLVMKGFILTLNEIRDIGYYPVTSPIFFAQVDCTADIPKTGVLTAKDPRYAWAEDSLRDIESKFSPTQKWRPEN